jgi:hypothetical protein
MTKFAPLWDVTLFSGGIAPLIFNLKVTPDGDECTFLWYKWLLVM